MWRKWIWLFWNYKNLVQASNNIKIIIHFWCPFLFFGFKPSAVQPSFMNDYFWRCIYCKQFALQQIMTNEFEHKGKRFPNSFHIYLERIAAEISYHFFSFDKAKTKKRLYILSLIHDNYNFNTYLSPYRVSYSHIIWKYMKYCM